MPAPLSTNTNPSAICAHCSLPIPAARNASEFCCPGCEFVFHTLHEAGLENFYALRAAGGDQTFKPEKAGQNRFQHFNDPLFLKDFLRPAPQGGAQIAFHLQGVHCAACVWLIERLPRVRSGVQSARLDFARSAVTVSFEPTQVLVSEIATALDAFGYYPTPLSEDELEHLERGADRSLLLRIGVAGLSAGNTMMLAFSLYQAMFTGIEPQYDALHKWSCLLLTVPAVVYSAWPFYRTAWASLKAGSLHLDLPISIGILIGFFTSTWNTIVGRGNVYFDSVSMLIFLLLLGRWGQQVAVKKAAAAMRYQPSFIPQHARKISGAAREEVYVKTLKVGDTIEVFPGEVVPADGAVAHGASSIDRAILTGESRPEPVERGAKVFAGTLNLSAPLQIEIEAVGEQSRVGRLLGAVRESLQSRSPLVELTNKISGYFVAISLLLAVMVFFGTIDLGVDTALQRVVALLVITCPCALGLAAPIALSVAVSRAAKCGIVVREPEALERLTKVRQIFFDKTGTLTSGRAQVRTWWLGAALNRAELKLSEPQSEEIKEVLSALRSLESGNEHPYAFAVFSQIAPEFAADFVRRESVSGSGVSGVDRAGRSWRLGSLRWVAQGSSELSPRARQCLNEIREQGLSPLLLESDGRIMAILAVGDEIKPGAREVLDELRKGHQLFLLSGDEKEVAASIGRRLGFTAEEIFAEQSPEQKMNLIQQAEARVPTAMIGDGVNDAGALSVASVGIGVRGGIEACLTTARVFVASSDVRILGEVFRGAERTLSVIKLNLWISLVYNVLGVWGAMSGLVNPLVAAIFMPLSSLSVVLTSALIPTYREQPWK